MDTTQTQLVQLHASFALAASSAYLWTSLPATIQKLAITRVLEGSIVRLARDPTGEDAHQERTVMRQVFTMLINVRVVILAAIVMEICLLNPMACVQLAITVQLVSYYGSISLIENQISTRDTRNLSICFITLSCASILVNSNLYHKKSNLRLGLRQMNNFTFISISSLCALSVQQ